MYWPLLHKIPAQMPRAKLLRFPREGSGPILLRFPRERLHAALEPGASKSAEISCSLQSRR
jgi:hypothetical protein